MGGKNDIKGEKNVFIKIVFVFFSKSDKKMAKKLNKKSGKSCKKIE